MNRVSEGDDVAGGEKARGSELDKAEELGARDVEGGTAETARREGKLAVVVWWSKPMRVKASASMEIRNRNR